MIGEYSLLKAIEPARLLESLCYDNEMVTWPHNTNVSVSTSIEVGRRVGKPGSDQRFRYSCYLCKTDTKSL